MLYNCVNDYQVIKESNEKTHLSLYISERRPKERDIV